jgi:hypothetical protein
MSLLRISRALPIRGQRPSRRCWRASPESAASLKAQRGPGEARALTVIAQAQLNYSDSPDIADWHNGTWESGVQQAPLVQTTFPNAAGALSVNAGGDSLDFTSQASDFYA